MKFSEFRDKLMGQKIISIITLDITDSVIRNELRRLSKEEYYEDIDDARLILLDNGKALIYVDMDSDGYRSGPWNIIFLESILDKGMTKEIKHINSEVIDVERIDNPDRDYLLITTKDYLIEMGQDQTDSYYPSNFFNIDEAKDFIFKKGEKLDLDD